MVIIKAYACKTTIDIRVVLAASVHGVVAQSAVPIGYVRGCQDDS